MFNHNIKKTQLCKHIAEMHEIDFARFLYCQHIAATHLATGQFEKKLISAILVCDQVKLEKALGADMQKWQQLLAKHKLLKASTIGSLVNILARHDIPETDIAYLRWVKDKRDYFVHRLYHDDAWPGDLDVSGCYTMIRRLIAIQFWLQRAERQIWRIFERARFVELDHVKGGILVTNMGIYHQDIGD